jgi:hypothetical protein
MITPIQSFSELSHGASSNRLPQFQQVMTEPT